MKRKWGWSIIGVLMLATLVACSNPGRSYITAQINETLEIEILPNASKMFIYRLRWPDERIPSHIYIERGAGAPKNPGQGGIQTGRDSHERLVQNALYVVTQSGYCRAGFLELDRSISRYHLWLRGECKDAATGNDRQLFKSPQILGPSAWRTVH